MHYLLSVLYTLLWFFQPSINPTPDCKIVGLWLSSDKQVKLQIFKKDQKYYGKVIWIKLGEDTGKFPYDIKNPDPSLRQRRIVGLEVLKNFDYDKQHEKWKDGLIYHPQHGKEYKGAMWLDQAQNLKIRAYWGVIYRTNTWTRIDD